MATSGKRPSTDSEGGPPPKKPALLIPTMDIGRVTGEEDLDIKVLQVQNRKLGERLRERNRYHVDLERKVDSLDEKHETHTRLLISLRRMIALLNAQLSVLCAPIGPPDNQLTNQMIAGIGESPKALEEVFQSLTDGVHQLGEAVTKGSEFKDVDVLSIIQDLRERDREHGNHDDELTLLESKIEDLNTSLADARFDLFKSQSHCEQLEFRLMHTTDELTKRPPLPVSAELGSPEEEVGVAGSETKSISEGTPHEEVERLTEELVDAQSLAETRLSEVTALHKQLATLTAGKEATMEEKKKPPSKEAVLESSVYKALQAQYSVAAHEITQLKMCFEEARQMLMSAKQQHFVCLDEIRGEELKYQGVVREEMSKLESALLSAQRDYQLLKVDYERTVVSNEQAAPRARELQVTVVSLQKSITQAKAETTRYKTRAHRAEQELAKTQSQESKSTDPPVAPPTTTAAAAAVKDGAEEVSKLKEEKGTLEIELTALRAASRPDIREKADILASERKYRNQVDELKKRFEDYRKDYEKRKEHIREEAGRKAKSLSEDNRHFQKELSAKKHEATVLISEMETTAQAFEEMQDQNIRLLQQIKEKDDANFKLMSERIKASCIHKLLLQEKSLTTNQLTALTTETQRLNEMMAVLQDKDRHIELTSGALEKELTAVNQAMEQHKKEAQNSVQSRLESGLVLQEQLKTVEGVRRSLTDKQTELDTASQNNRRLLEEIGLLKKRLEKYKSREWATSSDEVLLEEIRTYRAKLNCPCCSTRKKDTVLTKCFHVFCSECIRSRYDSRLRKCPKCGAAFGANDFHKIYLS